MAKHLTQNDIQSIISLLQNWQYKLTWPLLVEACEDKLGITTTRKTLSTKVEVVEAFNTAKDYLKNPGSQNYARPNSIDVAHKRIEGLAEKVVRLEAENKALKNKFIRWQFNAMSRGMNEDQLNMPLPASDVAD